MTELHEAAAPPATRRGRGSAQRSWTIIALLSTAVAAVAGGAGYWYLSPRQPPTQITKEHSSEPPFYLELKPFVVSIGNGEGTPHFVQLGLNLALPGKDAGNAVNGLLPEIQDAMRQTALGFKVEDIMTPAGVDKLRGAMIAAANRLLQERLGAAEIKWLSGAAAKAVLVHNIYFTTLIVE